MSFRSMQGAQKVAAMAAMLTVFTYQVPAAADPVAATPAAPVTAAAAATVAAPAAPAQPAPQEDGPGVGAYLSLLACAIIVARQIRKRGKTHIVLS